jgi:DNA-binding CsgD family transcriptional regulator
MTRDPEPPGPEPGAGTYWTGGDAVPAFYRVRHVAGEDGVVRPEIVARLTAHDLEAMFHLTHQQAAVACCLGARCTTAEIAAALGVRTSTVKSHVAMVLLKLGVSQREHVRDRILRLLNERAGPG